MSVKLYWWAKYERKIAHNVMWRGVWYFGTWRNLYFGLFFVEYKCYISKRKCTFKNIWSAGLNWISSKNDDARPFITLFISISHLCQWKHDLKPAVTMFFLQIPPNSHFSCKTYLRLIINLWKVLKSKKCCLNSKLKLTQNLSIFDPTMC